MLKLNSTIRKRPNIMNKITQFTTILGINRNVSRTLAVCALLALATAAQATPVTGDPVGNAFGWVAPSSNLLNANSQAPGHVGQANPYVMFNSNAAGSVTLDFINLAPGYAFFETRIDGIETGTTAHPVVTGDTIHTGGTGVGTLSSVLGKTFLASSTVDIRLALGGERDWDFDWTRFYAKPTGSVPDAGSSLALLSLGLASLGLIRLRK